MLRVTWDASAYRPGQTARALVRIQSGAGGCTLSASSEGPGGHADLTPSPEAASGDQAWSLAVPLPARGTYQLRLVAYHDAAALEAYQKTLVVAPALPEGARLARDEDGLRRLCQAHGGIYVPEEDPSALSAWLGTLATAQAPVQARSLVFSSPVWITLLMLLLLLEWILRRRRNLL